LAGHFSSTLDFVDFFLPAQFDVSPCYARSGAADLKHTTANLRFQLVRTLALA
jgi:hypothetical protein